MLRKLIDSPWTYFAGAALLAVIAIATQFELAIPSRPKGTVEDIAKLSERDDVSVIFILVDTLRADRLGIYGYDRDTTPVIDDLARHGIVFRHTYAQSSWTKSSMASLWTATNPKKNGVLRYNHTLPEEVTLPAEVFQQAGFRTAGIWRNSWLAYNFGFGQGFDKYVKPSANPERARANRAGGPSGRSLKGTDGDIGDSAVAFLRNFGRERFFLYLHYMDLHQYIYDDQAPDFGNTYSDFYDRSVNYTDRLIGSFLYEVDQLGLLPKTLIVIASDHGEAFQEHGYEGHARNLYREVTEVPFIIALPFVLEEGIVVDSLVANIDIWPTVLDMLGLPPLEDVDGRSLLPLVLEAGGAKDHPPTEGLERPVFAEIDRRWGNGQYKPEPLVSVTDATTRVFIDTRKPARAELYDRASDPGEKQNLASERPDQLAEYRELVEDYVADDEPPWQAPAGTVEIDEMELNQLKALGYRVER